MRTILALLILVVAVLAAILALSLSWSLGARVPTPSTGVNNLAVWNWLGAIPNNSAVAAIVAGIFGIVGGFFSAFLKIRYDLRGEYDKDLRNKRLVAYQALWQELQPLAFYSPPVPGHLQHRERALRGLTPVVLRGRRALLVEQSIVD